MVGDTVAAPTDVESLGRRLESLEERQLRADACLQEVAGMRLSAQWGNVHSELERLRKLFEFVESVLPKEAAQAMHFFNQRSCGPGASNALGVDVELERHRLQLEEQVQTHASETRLELEKLTIAIKGQQRELLGVDSRVDDLAKRMESTERATRERLGCQLRHGAAQCEGALQAAAKRPRRWRAGERCCGRDRRGVAAGSGGLAGGGARLA